MIFIIVKLSASKTKVFNVDPTTTVGDFKNIIAKEEDAESVKLVYKAKPLNNDHMTLSDVGITDSCTMFAAMGVFCGMININVKLSSAKNKRFGVDPTTTVGDFKRIIAKEERAQGVKLIYNAKSLTNDNVRLFDVGVTNNCNIFAAMKVLPGTNNNNNNNNNNQVTKHKGNMVNMVTSDCIVGMSDDCYVSEIKKLKLGRCGCIICPQCMRMLIKMQTRHHCRITCGSSHRTEIPLGVALTVAGYTAKESDAMQANITETWICAGPSGIKVCPNAKCSSFIYRRGDLNRVRCLSCKAYEFCWFCLQKWASSDRKVCGNDGCDLRAAYISLLHNSSKKSIFGIANVPETRLCVNVKCCSIIIHENGSKDMVCPHCRTHYCQSCLNIWGKGCNGSKHCVPAGTQEITNEMYNVIRT